MGEEGKSQFQNVIQKTNLCKILVPVNLDFLSGTQNSVKRQKKHCFQAEKYTVYICRICIHIGYVYSSLSDTSIRLKISVMYRLPIFLPTP